MALLSLHQVLSEFTRELSNATKLLDNIETNHGALHQPQVDLIFELAFLKIFIAWERFLENTFIRYLCGTSSLSGRKPIRTVSARYLADALIVISGDRGYADWVSVDVIVGRANRFFDSGEPYSTPIQSAATDLTNMRRIRNHIVHHSNKSRDDFNNMLVSIYGFRPQGMSTGRFLRQRTSVNNKQHIQEYTDVLQSVANMIVA